MKNNISFPNRVQISPCIISKAKHALGLKNKLVQNNKTCSNKYWNKVVDVLVEFYSIDSSKGDLAKSKYSDYIK